MEPTKLIFGVLIVAALLGMAPYAIWKQWQVLLRVRSDDELLPEERKYMRRMAWRRIACSLLMVVFAGLLVGSFFIEPADLPPGAEDADGKPVLNAEQRFYGYYWIVALLVLLAIIVLAALDIIATRRFGLRQYRQIQADRRAMIETQVARMRRERNGHM